MKMSFNMSVVFASEISDCANNLKNTCNASAISSVYRYNLLQVEDAVQNFVL